MHICWNALSLIPVEYMFFCICQDSIPVECIFCTDFFAKTFFCICWNVWCSIPVECMFFYKSSVNYVLFDLTRSLDVGNNTGKTTCWSIYYTKFRTFPKTTVIAVVAKLFFRSSEVVGSIPTKGTQFFYEQFNTHTQCYN